MMFFLRSRTRCLTDLGSQVRPPREVDPKFGEENGQTQKVQEEGDLRGADLRGPKNGDGDEDGAKRGALREYIYIYSY